MSKQEIDWSKAPEGATHYLPGTQLPWYRSDGQQVWMRWDGFSWGLIDPSNAAKKFMIKRTEEWNGKGLPPVGIDCEFWPKNSSAWEHCTVLAEHDGGRVVAVHCNDLTYSYAYGCGDQFRPIRTPEQIAAARIEEALVAINSTHELVKSLHEACQRNYGAKRQNDAEISSDIKQDNINLLAEKVLQIEHENSTRGVYIIDERTAKELVALAKELKQ